MDEIFELLEHLPAEVQEKCSELRQLDLQYEAKKEKLKKDSRDFFAVMRTLSPAECERRNRKFEKEHQEIRDIADRKVNISEYLHSALEKYQEHVEKDIFEFKANLKSHPEEVQLVEQEFVQAVKPKRKRKYSFNDDLGFKQLQSTSSAIPQMIENPLTPPLTPLSRPTPFKKPNTMPKHMQLLQDVYNGVEEGPSCSSAIPQKDKNALKPHSGHGSGTFKMPEKPGANSLAIRKQNEDEKAVPNFVSKSDQRGASTLSAIQQKDEDAFSQHSGHGSGTWDFFNRMIRKQKERKASMSEES